MSNSSTGRTGAGRAFLDSIQDDPDAKASWQRARILLQAMVASNEIREAVEAGRDDIESSGLPRPTNLSDWEYLAQRAGISFERVKGGDLTLADITTAVTAWADRVSDMRPDAAKPKRRGREKADYAGWMGDVELATVLGVHSSQIPAFRAKLKRMRDKRELSMDDWNEFENRKRNEPQFFYRATASAIVAMAKRYSLPK